MVGLARGPFRNQLRIVDNTNNKSGCLLHHSHLSPTDFENKNISELHPHPWHAL